ncbi:metallophosphoesterase, partial [bacterium]|nr:metallophosphoesterase [bacterium]
GIVIYRWGDFGLNPRSLEDLVTGLNQTTVTAAEVTIPLDLVGEVAITVSSLLPVWELDHYQFSLEWSPAIAAYHSWQIAGTLSAEGPLTVVESGNGVLDISFDCANPLSGSGTLLKLLFEAENIGATPVALTDFILGTTPLSNLNDGQLEAIAAVAAIGDTLTVIQRPLLTMPALVCPGDTLEIFCAADPAVTGWSATLSHPAATFPLALIDAVYDPSLTWWRLQTSIPSVPFYDQFDLQVDATGLPTDISRRAVKLLPEVPGQFFFAHFTDTHLPTHLYYYEPGSEADSSEMRDLRAILDDLAIINPAFILLTGDLVNEGELEEYLYRRYYTRAKGIMGESQVPIYLGGGNHDLGGWNDTPPPAGTARRDWWRFFGWSLCYSPPAGYPFYTQNYSFDYGPLHVAMLEGYDNYDSWRYNIYGSTSFTSGQLDWLEDDLTASAQPLKVLAHHYDFANQLNLNSLGVDLALWGHIHSDNGSIYQQPYDLATNNSCDGERAFRLIRVEGSELQPLATLSSGGSGQNLQVSWFPANDGTADTVTATVNNLFAVDFPEGLLRFYLSPAVSSCEVSGGTLQQMIQLPGAVECQVAVPLAASSTTEVSVMGMPAGPQNLLLQIYQQQLILTWEAMPGTSGYRVYLAQDPYGPFQNVSGEGIFNGSSWTAPVPPERGFYRVTGVY